MTGTECPRMVSCSGNGGHGGTQTGGAGVRRGRPQGVSWACSFPGHDSQVLSAPGQSFPAQKVGAGVAWGQHLLWGGDTRIPSGLEEEGAGPECWLILGRHICCPRKGRPVGPEL